MSTVSIEDAALEESRRMALEKIMASGRSAPATLHETLIKASSAAPPLASTDSNSKPLTANQRRKRAEIDLSYCEYNFSTMKDTKGGFLIEEVNPNEELPDSKKQKTVENEAYDDPFIDLINLDQNPKCQECDSMDIDILYFKHYKEQVCRSCRENSTNKYSLLTKTECKEVCHCYY
jgi:DNA-repair protein complementing XP-A cells